ncbi:MAG: class I SAM-dependent methyltransferase [Deltaproteobacteria bacterium]|nr:class I SAM-dependent methyltransferase [Deltaproteobacteria bacterium]
MNRTEKALSSINMKGVGLEIGPSYNPILPKSSGAKIKTVDHLNREGLLQKYSKHLSADLLARIEEVDYIWSGESLSELIGETNAFDYIIASHFIEHTTDLIGFLQDCDNLLKPNGVLSLIVPDKRFCFDRFKPLSTVGMVLDAYLKKEKIHSPGTVLDHLCYGVVRGDNILGWDAAHDDALKLHHADLGLLKDTMQDFINEPSYRDCHRWIFTPKSFALLVQDLRELNYHHLSEIGGFGTAGFEFFISLSRSPAQFARRDRLTMLMEVEEEMKAVAGASCDLSISAFAKKMIIGKWRSLAYFRRQRTACRK